MTMLKPLTVWIITTCEKLLKSWEPDQLTCLLRNLYAGQEAKVRTCMEELTGSGFRKEYNKVFPVTLI